MSDDKKKRMVRMLVKLTAVLALALVVARVGKQNYSQQTGGSTSTQQEQSVSGADGDSQHTTANNTTLSEGNDSDKKETIYTFRNNYLLEQHFEKHGDEFDYETAQDYENGASAVINNPDALHKTEAEDGDDVYFVEETGEFVVLSTDGYIRTYFKPDDGIRYFNRQ